MNTVPRLCLIEDDEIMGESLCDRFELEGYACDWHKTAASALASVGKNNYAVVISDIRLPDLSGNELFSRLQQSGLPLPPFIFISGYGSIDIAVELLKQGAEDYITKPFDLDLLLTKIRALAKPAHSNQIRQHSRALGISAEMRRIADTLPRLSSHANTILITGESGVGKEIVAKELHRSDPASTSNSFVAVNCGAITESLLEAELFGYEKGSFTGAARTKKGYFEQAHKGTLFLDEIGDMPLAMQVKLLRAIQERQIVRVGGETPIPVSLRLICATHRNLKKMVEQGLFREDLFYRINVILIKIPPLRERREEILWFADLFLKQFAEQHDEGHKTLHLSAEAALIAHGWPGNIRELHHLIERACILTAGTTLMSSDLFDFTPHDSSSIVADRASNLTDYMQACERLHILNALHEHQWQMTNTAEALNISRKNLWEKIKKHGIRSERSSISNDEERA